MSGYLLKLYLERINQQMMYTDQRIDLKYMLVILQKIADSKNTRLPARFSL